MQHSQLTTVSLIIPSLSPAAFITLSIFKVSWEKRAFYICEHLQVQSWPEPKYQVCVNWEMLQLFHRLLLVKLIIVFSHSGTSESYVLMSEAFSVCQQKDLLSCVTEGGASDCDEQK